MKCPHCGVEANFYFERAFISGSHGSSGYVTKFGICPADACQEAAVYLAKYNDDEGRRIPDDEFEWSLIVPRGTNRGPVPKEVPSLVAQDYREACEVLPISAKASAALSRRCLQSMLRAHGYTDRDLAREIDLLLNETDTSKAIPITLRSMVDAVRNFGNFSAHPITDVTTLQVIDVEPQEAEWCLEIIEECFQHFYVRPAEAAARIAALNAKLSAAGKPPAKA